MQQLTAHKRNIRFVDRWL